MLKILRAMSLIWLRESDIELVGTDIENLSPENFVDLATINRGLVTNWVI
jgi:hypothetical protein